MLGSGGGQKNRDVRFGGVEGTIIGIYIHIHAFSQRVADR